MDDARTLHQPGAEGTGQRPRAALITRRQGAYLPHWSRDQATYFVTFRLADSLPVTVLEGWTCEREGIVRRAEAMNRPLSDQELARLARLHSARVERYLDAGYGACHLRRPEIASLMRDAMFHSDGALYDMIAWCVMPNHVHCVLTLRPGVALAKIMQAWKGSTARLANTLLGTRGQFWQAESYDHLVRDDESLEKIVRYVLANPPRAGLAGWPWVGRGGPGSSPPASDVGELGKARDMKGEGEGGDTG